jgi:hypothetical protein
MIMPPEIMAAINEFEQTLRADRRPQRSGADPLLRCRHFVCKAVVRIDDALDFRGRAMSGGGRTMVTGLDRSIERVREERPLTEKETEIVARGRATMIHRRGLITGLISLVAAPAIVRASSIMPVRAILPTAPDLVREVYFRPGTWIHVTGFESAAPTPESLGFYRIDEGNRHVDVAIGAPRPPGNVVARGPFFFGNQSFSFLDRK